MPCRLRCDRGIAGQKDPCKALHGVNVLGVGVRPENRSWAKRNDIMHLRRGVGACLTKVQFVLLFS
jgi:hypothetical protein